MDTSSGSPSGLGTEVSTGNGSHPLRISRMLLAGTPSALAKMSRSNSHTATSAAAERSSGVSSFHWRDRADSRSPDEWPPVWKVSTVGIRARLVAESTIGGTSV